MMDYTLEDNIFHFFTTRTTTGAPTALANGEVKVLEDGKSAGVSPSTAGATLTADFNGITGLNRLLISANAAHGYANASQYTAYLSIGSVGSVNVTGEVVLQFTLGKSAAAVDLANSTDGLGAIKAETASILTDTAEIGAAGAGLTEAGGTGDHLTAIPSVGGLLTISAAALVSINAEVDTALTDYDAPTHAELLSRTLSSDGYASAGALLSLTNTVGIAGGGLTEAGGTGDQFTAIPSVAGLLTISAAALASINAEVDTALADYDGPTNAEMVARTILANDYATADSVAVYVSAGAIASLQTAADAIKTKTDSLTFTQAGHVDANVQRINDVAITGDGSGTPFGV